MALGCSQFSYIGALFFGLFTGGTVLVQSVRVFHLVRAIHELCAVGTGPEHIYSFHAHRFL